MQEAWSTAHANFLMSLTQVEAADLMVCARRLVLPRRRQLFSAGDAANAVFIVEKGCIKLYQLSPSGKEIILWFGFPGELFGIAETMRGSEREIYAEANVDSEVLSLSQSRFVDFLRVHPEAAMRAIGILSARVRTLGATLVDMSSGDVATRLNRLLLRFSAGSRPDACEHAHEPSEVCINVELTHSNLASLIGCTRQTVTSLLADLRRSGILRIVGHHFHITDSSKLKQLVDTD